MLEAIRRFVSERLVQQPSDGSSTNAAGPRRVELAACALLLELAHSDGEFSEEERQHIERTLKHHTGNRTRAAIELGISRATLINKIKRYNITS